MVTFPVHQSDGCRLDAFQPLTEAELDAYEPNLPLTASLVVLWDCGESLMVHNRFRHAWELPGGAIDPGESPAQAAVRELAEESGQVAERIELAGVAVSWYAPAARLERLAIYRGTVGERMPFVANDEMVASQWWDPATPLAGVVSEVDQALTILVPDGSGL